MSEATLKRKTFTKYRNNSVGKGFSLNGTHRSQGWIGQDTIGRSLQRTLMKGDVIRGHGGFQGTYPIYPVVTSAVTSLEDITVTKPSVLDNKGMIRTKYQWIWRPQPFSSTKADTSRTVNPQSVYIANLSATIAKRIDSNYPNVIGMDADTNQCVSDLPKNARPRPLTNPQITQTRRPCNIVKTNMTRPERNNPIMGILGGGYVNYIQNQSTYVAYLNSQCTDLSANYTEGNNTQIQSSCSVKPMQSTILKTPIVGC